MATFKTCFKGKLVLITGAGKGIGRALSVKLSQLGATVYAVSRTEADLENLKAEYPTVQAIHLDISDWAKTRATINKAIPGPIDILVNNAGVAYYTSFMDVTSEHFDELVGINLRALVNVSQICAQKMIDSGNGGTIINISSINSIKPLPGMPIYTATKAGVNSLTQTMAMELGKHQIKVVAMNWGYIWTDGAQKLSALNSPDQVEKKVYGDMGYMFPLGKALIPIEQAVDSILFVTSGSIDMMTGNGFILDGGCNAN